MPRTVSIAGHLFGEGRPLGFIAGPCVIESRDLVFTIAERLAELRLPLIFKASFDKANRSSAKSFRGPGLDAGLKILDDARTQFGLPLTTDVHETRQVQAVAAVVDLIQIPAFLARQTDLVHEAAATGKAVNVKKGQFMAPWDMKQVVAKVREAGNANLVLTERGSTFGYGTLVNDFRAIPLMQNLGCPVVYDATHSVQSPGGLGDRSGGDRTMAPVLARAAVAAGCDLLFFETHPDPDRALSDGPNMIPLDEFPAVARACLRIREALA